MHSARVANENYPHSNPVQNGTHYQAMHLVLGDGMLVASCYNSSESACPSMLQFHTQTK